MDKRTAQGKLLLHAAGQCSGTTLAERLYLLVDVTHQIIILFDGWYIKRKTVAKKLRFSSAVRVLMREKRPGIYPARWRIAL